MDPGVLVAAVIGPVVVAITAVTSSGAADGRIARNRFVGIRLRATLRTDAAWAAGHRAAVRPAWTSFAVLAGAGVAAMLLAISTPVAPALLSAALVVLIVASLAWITAAAVRAASHAD